jgi:hypothetical protein
MRMATEESICLEELDDTLKELYYQKEKLNNLIYFKKYDDIDNLNFDIELEINNTRHRIESLEKWRTHLESKTFGI